MSAPLAIDDVLSVSIAYTQAAQRLLMVLHYRVQAAGTGVDAETQLLNIGNRFADPAFVTGPVYLMRQCLAASTFVDYLRVQKVKPVRTIYAQVEINEFGAVAGTAAAVNSACSITKKSTHVGRNGIGRVQLGGLPAAWVGSYIDSDALGDQIGTFAESLITDVTVTIEGGMILNPCLPAGGVDHTFDLFDAVPQAETRTMHRRTVGLGI